MQQSVYFGQISHKDAERLLGKYGKDGSFLLRDSQSEHGALCLCVRRAPYVHTYRINHSPQGWALETEIKAKVKWFQSLDQLIESYKQTPHNMVPLLYPLEKSHLNEEERQVRGFHLANLAQLCEEYQKNVVTCNDQYLPDIPAAPLMVLS